MCGIAALLRLAGAPLADPSGVLDRMTELAAHRGPDGLGRELLALDDSRFRPTSSADWRVGLGHRRLSILDLSEAGRQPMAAGDDLWIVFNGEIYNYVELRAELVALGRSFRSQTDTEVILAAYREWGTGCFARMRGMWGLFIVDARARRAVVSRDRLGIKPLYLKRLDRALAVCSEIKQLTAIPGAITGPDEAALAEYLATGYENTRRTFFADVESLPSGTFATIDLDDLRVGAPESYWQPERIEADIVDRDEAGRMFAAVFRESVRIHLRSDVPVGCALSGGLDSSAISVLVAEQRRPGDPPFHTFSVTFPGESFDERRWIDAITSSLALVPHYVTPTAEGFTAEADRFVWTHDEPVGSFSQYAGYCVARLTREAGVPVTLNGQGGDEILGGYWQSYFAFLQSLLRRGNAVGLARHFAGALAPSGNHHLLLEAPKMLRRYLERRGAGEGARRRVGEILALDDQQRRIYEIRELHLPRLLKWDDRNFMAHSVEGRYPFLDHVVIETALRFAPSALHHRGWTKEPIRRGLAAELPASIARRRSKMGFPAPQERWLSGPLRRAIEDWLAHDSPLWQHCDRTELRRVAQTTWRTGALIPSQTLLRGWLADRWLRLFFF